MRVVAAGRCEPADALALDEAVVRAEPRNPVLILWHTRPAVVIGRFQRADWEVDPVACAERGVDVWRRFTGGGAVHLDPGTLCVGRVVPAGHPDAALGVPDLYAPLLTGIAAACRALGVESTVDERTVRVGGRKVTGVAAHRGRRATLVHGTLLGRRRPRCAGGLPRRAARRQPGRATPAGREPPGPRRERRCRHGRGRGGRRRSLRGQHGRRRAAHSERARARREPPARAIRRPRVACRTMARRHPREGDVRARRRCALDERDD